MGVECRHSGGLVSTPSPTLPLPGGGSQNIGRAAFGAQVAFHNAKRFVSHEHPKPRCRAGSDRADSDGLEVVLKGGQIGSTDVFGLARNGCR